MFIKPLLISTFATSIGIISDRTLGSRKPLTYYLFWFLMILGSIYACLPKNETSYPPYNNNNVVDTLMPVSDSDS